MERNAARFLRCSLFFCFLLLCPLWVLASENSLPITGVSLMPVGTLDGEIIPGSSCFRVRGENGLYAVAAYEDQMLHLLTDYQYDERSYLFGGIRNSHILIVSDPEKAENRYGALWEDGTVIVPFRYSHVVVLSEHWIAAVVDRPAAGTENAGRDAVPEETQDAAAASSPWSYPALEKIDSVEFYYVEDNGEASLRSVVSGEAILQDQQGNLPDACGEYLNFGNARTGELRTYDKYFHPVEPLPAEEASVFFTPVSHPTSMWDFTGIPAYGVYEYREGGLSGLKNAEGKVLMPPTYSDIFRFYGEYAQACMYGGGEENSESKSRYGLIDRTGREILPCEYDEILCFRDWDHTESYFTVVKDGKLGFAVKDRPGKAWLTDIDYESNRANIITAGSSSFVLQNADGSAELFSADGCQSHLELKGENTLWTVLDTRGFFWEQSYRDQNGERRNVLYDWHGEEICTDYDDADVTGDGRYILLTKDDTALLSEIIYWPSGDSLMDQDRDTSQQTMESGDKEVQEKALSSMAQAEQLLTESGSESLPDVTKKLKTLQTDLEYSYPLAAAALQIGLMKQPLYGDDTAFLMACIQKAEEILNGENIRVPSAEAVTVIR